MAPERAAGVLPDRVATASEVASTIRKRTGAGAEVLLVTSRMRPLARDDLDASIGPPLRWGRGRVATARRVVVIAAMPYIEAGADFDFDAIGIERACLDAVRHHVGRLNRLAATCAMPRRQATRSGGSSAPA